MSVVPMLPEPIALQAHIIAALLAMILGPIAIYRSRRDVLHKIVGRVWVVAMTAVAGSSFFLTAQILPLIAGFGPIHMLAVWVFISLGRGLRAIWRKDVATHRLCMASLYWQGLAFAALFTLLPGRRINAFFFGEAEWLGLGVIALFGAFALVYLVRRRMLA